LPSFAKEHKPYPDNFHFPWALVVKEISAVRNENSTHHATSGVMKIMKTRRDAIFLFTETDLGATIP